MCESFSFVFKEAVSALQNFRSLTNPEFPANADKLSLYSENNITNREKIIPQPGEQEPIKHSRSPDQGEQYL